MHFLVISKYPEFTENGEVVQGQCAPYTKGWRLRLLVDGREEELLKGTYGDLARVQRSCLGKAPEEVRTITAEASRAPAAAGGGSLPAGKIDQGTEMLGAEEVHKAMRDLDAAPEGPSRRAAWLDVSAQGGMRVATVTPPVGNVSPEEAAKTFSETLSSSQGGLVLDLAGLLPGGEKLASVLADLAVRAKGEGRFFAVVGASDDLMAAAGRAVSFYTDVTSAAAAAAGGTS